MPHYPVEPRPPRPPVEQQYPLGNHPVIFAQAIMGMVAFTLLLTDLDGGTVQGWLALILVLAGMLWLAERMARRWLREHGYLAHRAPANRANAPGARTDG